MLNYIDTDMPNRAKVIFLLGRPGSGKTLAAHLIAEYLQSVGFDRLKITIQRDYNILWAWFSQDRNQLKFEPGPWGGFRVKDFKVLDDCLRIINDRALQELKNKQVIIIEFSRKSYLSAFKIFDNRLLESSTMVYLHTPLNICLKRNEKRIIEADDNMTGYVPPDILQTYYQDDDIELLVNRFSNYVIQIDNSQYGIHLLRDKLVNAVLANLVLKSASKDIKV